MENKNEKRIRMVLYKMHDYDLVAYAWSLRDKTLGNAKISFYSVVKGLLNQYIGKGNFTPPKIKNYTKKALPSKITVRFTLDKKEDAELIELFENIKDRQKNSFLKSLVRRNLNLDGLACYFEESFDYKKYVKENNSNITEFKKPKESKKVQEKPNKTKIVAQKKEEFPDSSESSNFDFFGAIGNINM